MKLIVLTLDSSDVGFKAISYPMTILDIDLEQFTSYLVIFAVGTD